MATGGAFDLERKMEVDSAVKVAQDFVRLYYQSLEERPDRAYLLYLDNAVVIWDGNPQLGIPNLRKFFEGLPDVKYSVKSMDAHPVSSIAVGQKKSVIISTAGSMQTLGGDANTRSFFQNFVVTEEGGKWRVASDVFRSQNSPNQEDF